MQMRILIASKNSITVLVYCFNNHAYYRGNAILDYLIAKLQKVQCLCLIQEKLK
jgi:hypothetical protein